MIWKLIYRIWGKRIARAIRDNEVRPSGLGGLSYVGTDLDGALYWSWPKAELMPALRIMRVEACMVQIDHGTTSATADKFAQAMVDRCNNIATATTTKACKEQAVELIVLCKELTLRRKTLIPEETYFDLAAVCLVRQDEDPYTMDPTVHMQKVEALRKCAAAGDAFFLGCPPFREHLGRSLTTAEGLQSLLTNWMYRRLREQAMFASLSPAQG